MASPTDDVPAALDRVAASIQDAADRIVEAIASLRVAPGGPAPAAGSSAGPAAAKAVKKKRTEKPVLVSDELARFTGLDAAVPTTRTNATQAVMKYIKDNALQDRANRTNITPDDALGRLLDSGAVVTVLNLQSALKAHFSPVADGSA